MRMTALDKPNQWLCQTKAQNLKLLFFFRLSFVAKIRDLPVFIMWLGFDTRKKNQSAKKIRKPAL